MNQKTQEIPATDELCQNLANDLLRGADSIAEFMFGAASERRKVYYLANTGKRNSLPVFRMGSVLCARKSSLIQWIEAQEKTSRV